MKRKRVSQYLVILFAVLALSDVVLADDAEVIPVENADALKAQLNKAVIVKGTIAELKRFKNSGHALLNFKEADVGVFIRKEDLAKQEDWDLEALQGKEVFVAGQVKFFRDALEIIIVGPDQIADTPDGFDLEKIPLPEKEKTEKSAAKKTTKKKPKKIPGAIAPDSRERPEMPLKLEEASAQAVAFYVKDTGLKIKDDPYKLPKDSWVCTVATVTAKVEKVEGLGAMQVAFTKPEEDSKKRIKAMLEQLAETYGKWPRDHVVMIDVDFESRDFKDDPSTLVIAALIHSLVSGKEIASDVVISGEVGESGELLPAVANIDQYVTGSEMVKSVSDDAGAVRLIVPDLSADELNDLALEGDWEALGNVTVLGAASLKEGFQLIFADPSSELGKALAGFDEVQKVIREKGASMVRNQQVQQRVIAAGKAWPSNKSAAYYALSARGKVRRSYSLPRSYAELRDLHTQLRYTQGSRFDVDVAKDRFKELEGEMKSLTPKLDPELSETTRALSDFEREATTSILRPRKGSGGERQEEKLKESDAEVMEQLKALKAKIDGVELEAEE